MLVAQSYPTLCIPMDCSPPGSSVHEISQARILEQVAISFSRGFSFLTQRSNPHLLHCRWILYHWATWGWECVISLQKHRRKRNKIWISTRIFYHDASVQISCCTDNDIKHFSAMQTTAVAPASTTVTTMTAILLLYHTIHQA